MSAFVEIFLIGVGLSMDAFAVSVCKGLGMKKINKSHTFVIALFFGGFQALMPFLGWLLGTRFEKYITSIDHWIAFFLLALIGGKMIYEVFRGDNEEENIEMDKPLDIKELLILAIATSIDALAVGVTFGLLPDVNIIAAITLIGSTTFILSGVGLKVGNVFGLRYKSKAELAGGIILILIGIKILLEHLGVISF